MVFVEPNNPSAISSTAKKMVGLSSIPHWLEVLLGEKFFNPCLVHESEKKNEKNTFCLDCCASLCPHCLPPHWSHTLLQIRRYVYQDVIRLNDAQKLMDCSLVQSYTTNSAKVLFLNQRPLTRQFKGSGNVCIICDRNLQDHYRFCSISCKAHHQMISARVGPNNPHFCDAELKGERVESSLELEGGRMTPDSVLDLPISLRTSSGSSSGGVGGQNCGRSTLACTATTEFVKRKRSAVSVSRRRMNLPAFEFPRVSNRRKGVPQRSPLY